MTKPLIKSIYHNILYAWDRWSYFWWLFHSWQRLDNLQDLYDWAERKKLGVQYYYKRQFKNELVTLKIHTEANPQTVQWSRRLYKFWQFIKPEPQYYPKGYTSRFNI